MFNVYGLNYSIQEGVKGVRDYCIVDVYRGCPGFSWSAEHQRRDCQGMCVGTVNVDFDVGKSTVR